MYALARAQDLFVDYLFEGFLLIIYRHPSNFSSLLKSRNLHPLLGNDFLFVHYGFKPILMLIKLFLYNQNFHEKQELHCLLEYRDRRFIIV